MAYHHCEKHGIIIAPDDIINGLNNTCHKKLLGWGTGDSVPPGYDTPKGAPMPQCRCRSGLQTYTAKDAHGLYCPIHSFPKGAPMDDELTGSEAMKKSLADFDQLLKDLKEIDLRPMSYDNAPPSYALIAGYCLGVLDALMSRDKNGHYFLKWPEHWIQNEVGETVAKLKRILDADASP